MIRILLAEDEPVLARNIARSLRKTGAQVLHAPSAAAASKALSTGRFDLVAADISLGDGDGLEVLKNAGSKLENVPVIVMTGQDSISNRARAEGLSVAAFLSKPFALSRLNELVRALTYRPDPNATHAKGPSVVMYSHDTIGLGHMRRNSAIAQQLVAQVPNLSVLMLVGCPAGMMFETLPGIDYVKLPSLSKLGRGVFQAGSLRLDAATTRNVRASIVEGVLDTIQPDLFLVDHEPAGAMDELVAVLNKLKKTGTRTVLGLRDILDDPDKTRSAWSASGTDKLISHAYDHILVYGDARFFPSAQVYGLNDLKPGAVTECGVVTTVQAGKRAPPQGAPAKVIVSGGGGRDAYPLIEAAILAVGSLADHKRPQMTVITGPLMDAELKIEAFRLGATAGVEVLEHVADLPARMRNADLLISMTGYNSINEALAIGCPILTVPRLGPSAEQRLRAESLERLGLAHYLHREDLSPDNIARILQCVPQTPPPNQLRIDGVKNAARLLSDMVTAGRNQDKEPSHACS